jgi:hypothetical protein
MRLVLPLAGHRDNVDTLIYSASFAPCPARVGPIDRIVDVLEAKRVIFARRTDRDNSLELAFGPLQL